MSWQQDWQKQESDPRDGPRSRYVGNDSRNVAMRPALQQLIEKLKSMKTLSEPRAKRYVLQHLATTLPVVELAELTAYLHRLLWARLYKEEFTYGSTDSITGDLRRGLTPDGGTTDSDT